MDIRSKIVIKVGSLEKVIYHVYGGAKQIVHDELKVIVPICIGSKIDDIAQYFIKRKGNGIYYEGNESDEYTWEVKYTIVFERNKARLFFDNPYNAHQCYTKEFKKLNLRRFKKI